MSGIVTISIELELGWSMHDISNFSHLSDDRRFEETALSRLLTACDRNGLQVSFDVVGHLFEDSCQGEHGGPYPSGWWTNDPGTSHEEDPQFYAPELIEKIIDSEMNHEICTHTYSHVLAEEVGEETLRCELEKVKDIHSEWGLPSPQSIVMPRHQHIDYSIIKDFGINTIRRPIKNYEPPEMNPVEKLWWLVTRDHPKCELNTVQELVETSCTPHPSLTGTILPTGRDATPSYFRVLPQKMKERIHYRYLRDAVELAAETGCHIHLWTHLFNMANDSQWRAVEPAIDYLGRLQRQGDIDIYCMRELPEVVEWG